MFIIDEAPLKSFLIDLIASHSPQYVLIFKDETYTSVLTEQDITDNSKLLPADKVNDLLAAREIPIEILIDTELMKIWGRPEPALVHLLSHFNNLFGAYFEENRQQSDEQNLIDNAFSDLYNAFAVNIGDDFLFSYLIGTIVKFLNAEVGLLQIFDDNDVMNFSMGFKSESLKQITYEGMEIKDYLFGAKDILLINEAEDNPKIHIEDSDRQHMKSIMAVPLFNKGVLVAIIYLVNKSYAADSDSFNEADKQFVSNLSIQIGAIITNALLYKKTIELKEFNEEVLENIPVGILNASADGKTIFTNRYMRDFLAEMKMSLSSIIELVENKADPEFFGKEFHIPVKDRDFYLSVSKRILSIGYKPSVHLYTIFDITSEKEIESQLRRTEKLASAGELVSSIAHEIKNPLTSIKGFADLLWQRIHDEEFVLKFANIVSREINRLNNIIERFLSFAKPQIGVLSTVDMNSIISEVSEVIGYSLKESRITLELHTKREIIVYGNRELLTQVMMNVILNSIQALKNTKRKKKYIRITENFVDGNADIVIEDNGEGIKKEDLDKVFNPFYTTKSQGSGLGLSISHRIVTEHKGTMILESKVGEFTRLTIQLPVFEKSWVEEK
ncbi:MAG: GAF domain-containing protein [Brevinematales bacterium]|nr:GAF domain-containing protein [Brevinematales bacterium]